MPSWIILDHITVVPGCCIPELLSWSPDLDLTIFCRASTLRDGQTVGQHWTEGCGLIDACWASNQDLVPISAVVAVEAQPTVLQRKFQACESVGLHKEWNIMKDPTKKWGMVEDWTGWYWIVRYCQMSQMNVACQHEQSVLKWPADLWGSTLDAASTSDRPSHNISSSACSGSDSAIRA